MDLGNTGQSLLDRGREIVQRVTFIVNEDLARAEFVRDNRPKTGEVAAASIVTSQVRRLAGMNPAVGAWMDEYSRFTGTHGAALLISYPILAGQLFEFYDAVGRAYQFTNGARQWAAQADGGVTAQLFENPAAGFGEVAAKLGTAGKIGAALLALWLSWQIVKSFK